MRSILIALVLMLALPAAHGADTDCNQSGENLGADDSPNLQYFKDLLARGQAAPIQDFLKLWYPDRAQEIDGAYFLEDCQNPNQNHNLKMVDGKVPDACKPDTLYSWQPWSHVQGTLAALSPNSAWSGAPRKALDNTVWVTISAVSTYSYGSTLMRFKIKPAANYADSFASTDTDIGYPENLLQDMVIDGAAVIESYSYGTPEIYDEIVRDTLRIASGKPARTYAEWIGRGKDATGMDRVYGAGVSERTDQTETLLKSRLLQLIDSIVNHEGRIIYAQGACQNRRLHYATKHPTYINPYGY